MDIKADGFLIPYPGTSNIGFIRQNQGRCHSVYRHTAAFVVVSDGGNNNRDLLRRKIHSVQNPECHQRAALAVIHPIHHIADIVEESRYFRQFHSPRGIVQLLQDLSRRLCHPGHMGKAMLRVSQGFQRKIRLGNINLYGLILFYLFVSHNSPPYL